MAYFHALVPCGGTGSRAGAGLPKQYRSIAGAPMVAHTLGALAQVRRLGHVVAVVAPDDEHFQRLLGASYLIAKCAGDTRAATVFNGLKWLLEQGATPSDWVLVHDAARCMITAAQVNALIDAVADDAVGGLLAQPLADTLKVEEQGRVMATLVREDKWLAQTPQMFRIGKLLEALTRADERVTDEASAIEALGLRPKLVAGSAQNFKVTYPEDFALAEALLLARHKQVPSKGARSGAAAADKTPMTERRK